MDENRVDVRKEAEAITTGVMIIVAIGMLAGGKPDMDRISKMSTDMVEASLQKLRTKLRAEILDEVQSADEALTAVTNPAA